MSSTRPGAVAAVRDMDIGEVTVAVVEGASEEEVAAAAAVVVEPPAAGRDEAAEETSGSSENNTNAPVTESGFEGKGEGIEREEEKETAGPGAEAAKEAAAPPPARLLITKMVMENFKSYGGLREIGPFHKCFSSIVGPNGSGKSNVIDAMLFVFGKRAKKLRLNKVSELIHRSDTYPNLDFARVSVHFVDIVDVEGSEDDYEEVLKDY